MRFFFGTSIAVFLAGVIAYFAAPAVQSSIRVSRARATLADLRGFAAAFQTYGHDHGNWPAGDRPPGVAPAGMEAALRDSAWRQPTPIGGRYVWLTDTVQQTQRAHAVIAIVHTSDHPSALDARDVEELYRQARASGITQLRPGFRHEPIFLLE